MPLPSPPITNTTAGINYQQSALINVLKQYFAAKTPPAELPFSSAYGICSGLVAYWLYSRRIGEEGKFLHRLEYALSFNSEDMKAKQKKEDQLLEEFINNIMFLQLDPTLRHDITHATVDSSFDLLLSDLHPKVNPCEFNISFVFNASTLGDLIKTVDFQNKMIFMHNGLHMIGLMRSDDLFYLYDPNSKLGPQTFSSIEGLVTVILESLKQSKYGEYSAISIQIYDVADPTPELYPNPLQYCKDLLQNPDYHTATINHPNIFYLGAKMRDYSMLDLLFDNGYKYIPWSHSAVNEVVQAVLEHDIAKLKYLANHSISFDLRPPNGTTAIGKAIHKNYNDMLHELLEFGADPNLSPHPYISVMKIILDNNNPGALILLLADGMELSDSLIDSLKSHYTNAELMAIITHTLILHSEFNIYNKSLSAGVLKLLAQLTKDIIDRPLNEMGEAEIQQCNDYLYNLERICGIQSGVQKSVSKARDQIAAYLHAAATPPKQSLVFRNIRSYSTDIAPLLSLKLKI